MPCNCGKQGTTQQKYVFVAPNGNQTTYNTEIEARAAKIRYGGGEVKPA